MGETPELPLSDVHRSTLTHVTPEAPLRRSRMTSAMRRPGMARAASSFPHAAATMERRRAPVTCSVCSNSLSSNCGPWSSSN